MRYFTCIVVAKFTIWSAKRRLRLKIMLLFRNGKRTLCPKIYKVFGILKTTLAFKQFPVGNMQFSTVHIHPHSSVVACMNTIWIPFKIQSFLGQLTPLCSVNTGWLSYDKANQVVLKCNCFCFPSIGSEWRLLLISERSLAGYLPGGHEVFKIEKVAIVTLVVETELDVELKVRDKWF